MRDSLANRTLKVIKSILRDMLPLPMAWIIFVAITYMGLRNATQGSFDTNTLLIFLIQTILLSATGIIYYLSKINSSINFHFPNRREQLQAISDLLTGSWVETSKFIPEEETVLITFEWGYAQITQEGQLTIFIILNRISNPDCIKRLQQTGYATNETNDILEKAKPINLRSPRMVEIEIYETCLLINGFMKAKVPEKNV